jgi:hypothetical protein
MTQKDSILKFASSGITGLYTITGGGKCKPKSKKSKSKKCKSTKSHKSSKSHKSHGSHGGGCCY